MKKNSLASWLGPNFRRILFASCEFGGIDHNQPMLSEPASKPARVTAERSTRTTQAAAGTMRECLPVFSAAAASED